MNFPYGQAELDYLSAKDAKLAAVIAKVGKIEREVNPDVFGALVSSIIGQQISGKAATTIRQRIVKLCWGEVTPRRLCGLSDDSLAACGLNYPKINYLRKAATAAMTGQVDFAALKALPDDKFIDKITSLPGVGRWTAEMLLIFSLQRPDVISYDDLGIRKGMQLLYGIDNVRRKDFLRLSEAYHPYATIASFYLWYVGNNDWQP